MKWILVGLSAVVGVALVLAGARTQASGEQKVPEPLSRPQPDWMKWIDQGANDPRLKGLLAPAGVKVEIVAEAPVVVNPVGLTFGPDGTLYVLEWAPSAKAEPQENMRTFTFKDGTKRQVAVLKKAAKDRVKILLDTRGAGKYDQAKVILEEEMPSSILLHDGYLYLSGQGTVRRYRQTKPAGPYGSSEVIAQGFGGYGQHQVSGLTIGPDGWLYITAGDNDNVVEGADGSRADVLRTGAVFRCRPDGKSLQVFAQGFYNPFRDVAFDPAGNMFHADNDLADGSKYAGCRLLHVAETADFGWRLRPGARCCQPDLVRSAVFGELPGKLPPLLKTGRGAPAGLVICNDTYFPEPYRGLLYAPDVVRQAVRAYKVERQGATFAVVEEFDFLKSNDPLFRPCQMVVGPDGALFVCDWRTAARGAGWLRGDGQHGRIYRLTWAGTKEHPAIAPRGRDSWAKIHKQSDADLLKTLTSDNFSDRQQAQQVLIQHGARNRKALLQLLADDDRPLPARMAALGVVQSFWNKDVAAVFVKLLAHPLSDLRRLAVEGLGRQAPHGDVAVHQALEQLLNDEDLAVRRAVVLAIGRIGAEGAADTLVNALKADDSKDRYLHDGIVRAIERLGQPGIDALLVLSNSGKRADLNLVVDTFLALRTRPAVDALPVLLKNYHLTGEQQALLIRSYNNYLFEPPVSVAPLITYVGALAHQAKSVPSSAERDRQLATLVPAKLAALEVLASGGELQSERGTKLLLALIEEEDAAAVRVAALKAVADTRFAAAGPVLTRRLAGNMAGNAEERRALLNALAVLKEKTAVPVLEKILGDKMRSSTPEGRLVQAEALRTLGAVDVATALPFAKSFLEMGDPVLQKAAIPVLGTTPAGAKLAAEQFLAGKLSRDLRPLVVEALRPHAGGNAELRKLLEEVEGRAQQVPGGS